MILSKKSQKSLEKYFYYHRKETERALNRMLDTLSADQLENYIGRVDEFKKKEIIIEEKRDVSNPILGSLESSLIHSSEGSEEYKRPMVIRDIRSIRKTEGSDIQGRNGDFKFEQFGSFFKPKILDFEDSEQ